MTSSKTYSAIYVKYCNFSNELKAVVLCLIVGFVLVSILVNTATSAKTFAQIVNEALLIFTNT